jgi:hypothetical protein
MILNYYGALCPTPPIGTHNFTSLSALRHRLDATSFEEFILAARNAEHYRDTLVSYRANME